jgi:hypothetical protein
MIRIETHPTDSPLTGQSKWWGEPDMLYKVVLSDGKLDRDEDYTYWDIMDECDLPTPTSR